MPLPVGLVHLLKQLPMITAPSLFTYMVLNYGFRSMFPGTLPSLPTLLASILATPLYMVLSSVCKNFDNRRAATKCGAVLPTSIDASWGGLSTAEALQRNLKHGYPGDAFREWSGKYGHTYAFDILSEHGIVTTEPNHIKAVLATQFDEFEKGPLSASQLGSLLGTGVFNSDGERWKFHRSMTRPFFSKDRISHFDIFDKHAEDALHQVSVRLEEGYAVDIQDIISKFTLDSATEFLFGSNVQSLSAGLDYPISSPRHITTSDHQHPSRAFAEAFLQGQFITALRTVSGWHWPLFEWFDQVKPHREVVNKYIDPIIAAAIQRYNARMPSVADTDDEPETLLDHLVKTTRDHHILQDEILNIMIAGRDTTACTLTYAVYMLAENLQALQRLQAEIIENVGYTRRPNFDDLRAMKYLRAFINETLRLYPPVPFDKRASIVSTTLPPASPGDKPIFVPKDWTVIYSVFLMHRRTDLWGPDAAIFDPDRFLDDRLKRVTNNPYIFLPFNGGPRICLGQQFAYNEVSYFLVKLLQRFSGISLALEALPSSFRPPAEWAVGSGIKSKEKVFPGVHLTIYVKGGLWVNMKAATTVDA